MLTTPRRPCGQRPPGFSHQRGRATPPGTRAGGSPHLTSPATNTHASPAKRGGSESERAQGRLIPYHHGREGPAKKKTHPSHLWGPRSRHDRSPSLRCAAESCPTQRTTHPAPLPRPDIAGSCNRVTRCRRRMGIAVDVLDGSPEPTVFNNNKLTTLPTNNTFIHLKATGHKYDFNCIVSNFVLEILLI